MGTLEDMFGGRFADRSPWEGDRFMNVTLALNAIAERTGHSTHKALSAVAHAVRRGNGSPLMPCWGCKASLLLRWNGDRPRFVHTKPMCLVFRGLK